MSIRWILFGLVLSAVFPTFAREAVIFPDPVVDAAVRKAVAKPEGPIYDEDLLELTEIMLYQSEARDLTGLEHCVNVTWLNCQSNKIENIDCLKKMPQLERVWFTYNKITDLTPFRGLKNLTDLNIAHNPVEDISPLGELPALERLVIAGLTLDQPQVVAGMTKLQELYISRASLKNLDFVSQMTELRVLSAADNQIESLEPLRGLTKLMDIKLDGNQIADISPLANLKEVWRLNLEHNKLTSLEGCPGLVKNARVELYENQITNIRPLVEASGFIGSIVIDLGRNHLGKEAFCRDIPELEARGNQVLYKYESPIEKSVRYPDISTLCEAMDQEDGALILAAVNRGATETELTDRFDLAFASPPAAEPTPEVQRAPEPQPEPMLVAAASPVTPVLPTSEVATSPDSAASFAVKLADTELNVSLETSGFGPNAMLGVIAFLGIAALLVIAWRIPRFR